MFKKITFTAHKPQWVPEDSNYVQLEPEEDLWRQFHLFVENLKKIGNDYLGKFKWREMEEVPDEGLTSWGPIELSNKFIYKGQWKDGRRHGRGLELSDDFNSLYIGEWKEGQKSGYGRQVTTAPTVYCGEWENGIAHGFGVYLDQDGVLFEGQFYKDVQHGQGKETFPDGKVYEGDFEFGIKTGYGSLSWPNGNYYEGEFCENLIDGKGKS